MGFKGNPTFFYREDMSTLILRLVLVNLHGSTDMNQLFLNLERWGKWTSWVELRNKQRIHSRYRHDLDWYRLLWTLKRGHICKQFLNWPLQTLRKQSRAEGYSKHTRPPHGVNIFVLEEKGSWIAWLLMTVQFSGVARVICPPQNSVYEGWGVGFVLSGSSTGLSSWHDILTHYVNSD